MIVSKIFHLPTMSLSIPKILSIKLYIYVSYVALIKIKEICITETPKPF